MRWYLAALDIEGWIPTRGGVTTNDGPSDKTPEKTPDAVNVERFLPPSLRGRNHQHGPQRHQGYDPDPERCSAARAVRRSKAPSSRFHGLLSPGRCRAHAVMLCEAGQRWHNRGALLRLWCWWRCSIARRCRPWPRCSSGLLPRVVELAADPAGGSLMATARPASSSASAETAAPVESVGALWAAAKPVTDDADLARQLSGDV